MYLFSKVSVALCHRGGRRWEVDILKEGNDVFLPEDAMVFLFEVDEGVGGLRVPDVGLPGLDPQP